MTRTGWDRAAGSIANARTALRSHDLRRLLAARMASQVAEGAFLAGVLQIVVFLPEQQSTLSGLALATALTLLPFSLVEPVFGVFVDRWRRRRILVVVPLARAVAALLILPGAGALALVYLATFVVFSLNRIFQTTTTAVIPRVLPLGDDERTADERIPPEGPEAAPGAHSLLFVANTLSAIVGTVALFGGLSTGGRLVASAGMPALLALICVSWIAASLLGSTLSSSLAPARPAAAPPSGELGAALADLRDGFRRIAATPGALVPVLTIAVGQFMQVVVIAVSLVVLKEGLNEGIVTFSWLVAAGGAGVFLGFLTVGWLGRRVSSHALIGVAFFLSAVAVVPAVATFSAATLSVGAVLLGMSYAWARVPADTIAQQAVPDRYRGRVFAVMDLGFNTARVLGAVAAVRVVPLLGTRTTLALAAVLFMLWGVVAPRWLRAEGLD